MEKFHTIVVIVAVGILILLLIVLGVMMSMKNNRMVYPPAYSNCPDYWSANTDGTCSVPLVGNVNRPTGAYNSTGDKGKANTPGYNGASSIINFNHDDWKTLYPNVSAQCTLKKWADKYNVTWDGISNYNQC